MSEGDSWTEVRRSVPAEHVPEVPNEASVYLCYTETERHLTVYSTAETKFAVLGNCNEIERVVELDDVDDVEGRAKEIRDQWDEYAEEGTHTGHQGVNGYVSQ
jgi:hypothetical protein